MDGSTPTQSLVKAWSKLGQSPVCGTPKEGLKIVLFLFSINKIAYNQRT